MNQQRYDDLVSSGFTGALNDMERSAFLTAGSSSSALDNAMREWLVSQEVSGANPDMWIKYARSLGFTGSINDVIVASRAYSNISPPGPTDPDFNLVALLLQLDGTNGSTIFTDSSSSPKTPVASGSAQISTAQSKFGGASLALDGNGDYLTVSGFTGWNIRTTPFTFECFGKRVVAGNQYFLCGATSTLNLTQPNGQNLYFGNVGGTLYLGDGATNNIGVSSNISDSVFQHVALAFDGTTYRIFFDGVSVASSTTLLKNETVAAIQIGGRSQENHYHQGWLDSVRLTIGKARYTSPFTPPSEPFPNS